jgi:hypothetical protein
VYITIVLFLPFVFLSTLTYFKIFFFHDTLLSFEYFKYFYDNLISYNHIPTWLENSYGGARLSLMFNFPLELSSLFIVVGYFLKINAYYIFLVYLTLIYSIYNFGLIKLINFFDLKNKLFISILISLISILSINIFNEYIFTIFSYILFPYYIYYFLKFKKNQKIQEFFKIINLYLIKFCIFFHYINIIEFYFLIFCTFIIILRSSGIKNFFDKLFLKKNLKNFFLQGLLIFLIFLNYIHNKSFDLMHYQRLGDGSLTFENFSTSKDGLINANFKIHSFFSNYLFGESNLIIFNTGLFFLIYAITKFEIRRLFIIRFSIVVSVLFILFSFIDLYEKNLRYYIYVILYQIPLIKYQFHLFYWHLFAKTFILIIIAFGINSFFIDLKLNNKKYLILSANIFLILMISYFVFYYNFKNNYFDRYAKVSLIISVITMISFFIITYKAKNLAFSELPHIKILIILTMLPVAIFNFSNYSFSNNYSFIKKNMKNDNYIKKYENAYFNNSNLKVFEFDCKNRKEIYDLIPATRIKYFVIRGSTDYDANIINQNIYGCDQIFALGRVENIKNFKNKPKNFIFDEAKNVKRYNNQFFSFTINKPTTKIITNISYNKNWQIYGLDNKKIEFTNDNNFLVIYPKNNLTFFLKYHDYYETYFILAKLTLGLMLNLFFLFILFKKKIHN